MMIPKRTAIVHAVPGCSATRVSVGISVPKLPGDSDTAGPDDRSDTRPYLATIRKAPRQKPTVQSFIETLRQMRAEMEA